MLGPDFEFQPDGVTLIVSVPRRAAATGSSVELQRSGELQTWLPASDVTLISNERIPGSSPTVDLLTFSVILPPLLGRGLLLFLLILALELRGAADVHEEERQSAESGEDDEGEQEAEETAHGGRVGCDARDSSAGSEQGGVGAVESIAKGEGTPGIEEFQPGMGGHHGSDQRFVLLGLQRAGGVDEAPSRLQARHRVHEDPALGFHQGPDLIGPESPPGIDPSTQHAGIRAGDIEGPEARRVGKECSSRWSPFP